MTIIHPNKEPVVTEEYALCVEPLSTLMTVVTVLEPVYPV